MYMMLSTSLSYDTTPIRCNPLPLHPPVINTHFGSKAAVSVGLVYCSYALVICMFILLCVRVVCLSVGTRPRPGRLGEGGLVPRELRQGPEISRKAILFKPNSEISSII